MPLSKTAKEQHEASKEKAKGAAASSLPNSFQNLVLSAAVENKMQSLKDFFEPLWKSLEEVDSPMEEGTKWKLLLSELTGHEGSDGGANYWVYKASIRELQAMEKFMEEGVKKVESFKALIKEPKKAQELRELVSQASGILVAAGSADDKELAIPLSGYGLGLMKKDFEGKPQETMIVRPLKKIEFKEFAKASSVETKAQLLSVLETQSKKLETAAPDAGAGALSALEKELLEGYKASGDLKENLERESQITSTLIGNKLEKTRPSLLVSEPLPDFTMSTAQLQKLIKSVKRTSSMKMVSDTAPLYENSSSLHRRVPPRSEKNESKAQSIEYKWLDNTRHFWRQQIMRSISSDAIVGLPTTTGGNGSWWFRALVENGGDLTRVGKFELRTSQGNQELSSTSYRTTDEFHKSMKLLGLNTNEVGAKQNTDFQGASLTLIHKSMKGAETVIDVSGEASKKRGLGWLTGLAKFANSASWSKRLAIPGEGERDPVEVQACKDTLVQIKALSERWKKGFQEIEEVLVEESLAFTSARINEWLKKWNIDAAYEHAKGSGLLTTDAISWGLVQGDQLKNKAGGTGPLSDLALECGYALGLNFKGSRTLEEQFTDQLQEMGLSERGIGFLGKSSVMQSFIKEQVKTFKLKDKDKKERAKVYIRFALDLADAWESVASKENPGVGLNAEKHAILSAGKLRAKESSQLEIPFERQEELLRGLLKITCEENEGFARYTNINDGIGRTLGKQEVGSGEKAQVFGALIKGKEVHYGSFLKSWVEDTYELEGQFRESPKDKLNKMHESRWNAVISRLNLDFRNTTAEENGVIKVYNGKCGNSINWSAKPFDSLALWEVLWMPSGRMLSLDIQMKEMIANSKVAIEEQSTAQRVQEIKSHVETDTLLKHPLASIALKSGVIDASDGMDIMAQMRSLLIDKYKISPAMWKSMVKNEEFAKSVIVGLDLEDKESERYGGRTSNYSLENVKKVYQPKFDIKALVAKSLEEQGRSGAVESVAEEEKLQVKQAVEGAVRDIVKSMHLSDYQVDVLKDIGGPARELGRQSEADTEEEKVLKNPLLRLSSLLNGYMGRGLDEHAIGGLLKLHTDRSIKESYPVLFTDRLPAIRTNDWQECDLLQKESGFKKQTAKKFRQDVVELYQKSLSAYVKEHPNTSMELRHEAAYLTTRDKLQNLVDYMKHLDPGVYEQNQALGLSGWLRCSGEWHQEELARIADEAARAGEKYLKNAAEAKSIFEKQTSVAWFPIVGIHQRDGWVAKELITVDEMIAEGKKMSHCVSSYATDCREGKKRVFSISLMDSPIATLEIGPYDENNERITWQSANALTKVKIAQNKGRFNASITSPAALEFCGEVEEKMQMNFAALYTKKVAEEEAKKEAKKEAAKRAQKKSKVPEGAGSIEALEVQSNPVGGEEVQAQIPGRRRRAQAN